MFINNTFMRSSFINIQPTVYNCFIYSSFLKQGFLNKGFTYLLTLLTKPITTTNLSLL
jgi:hypothetical protein